MAEHLQKKYPSEKYQLWKLSASGCVDKGWDPAVTQSLADYFSISESGTGYYWEGGRGPITVSEEVTFVGGKRQLWTMDGKLQFLMVSISVNGIWDGSISRDSYEDPIKCHLRLLNNAMSDVKKLCAFHWVDWNREMSFLKPILLCWGLACSGAADQFNGWTAEE